jgi:cyclopropane fatty-acyl-phospholipid synthase-like methyltransferase
MLKQALRLGAVLVAFSLVFSAGLGQDKGGKDKSGKDEAKYSNFTYVPTADEVIEKMFEMGKVNKNDMIFDLGCGDGRILFMAAKKFGSHGVGIDLNPQRIEEAMGQFRKYDTGTNVEIRFGDALKVKDLSDATVVVMYMFPEFMDLWFPIAKERLKPGTRILSHDYSWDTTKGDKWQPVRTETVKSSHRDNHKVLMWIVPEKGKTSASSRSN